MRRVLLIALAVVTVVAVSAVLQSDGFASPKKVVYQCGDGIDNDGDGVADWPDDPQCLAAYDYNELSQCSDGIDNDGSGEADYPADVDGCSSPEDDIEQDVPTTPCSDHYDNDLDGYADWPADKGCRDAGDLSESPNPKRVDLPPQR